MDLEPLRESVADVLSAECNLDTVHKYVNGQVGLDHTLWAIAGDLGWAAACLPEDAGFGVGAISVFGEEFGRVLAPDEVTTLLIGAAILNAYASPTLRRRYLDKVLAGQVRVAIEASLKMPHAASHDVCALGGEQADILLIKMPAAEGAGFELGLIELADAATTVVARASWDITRSLSVVSVEKLEVHRLGLPAYELAVRMMALLLASDSLGLSQKITSRTVDYLSLRQQFGKKLASFQALKHRLADLFISHHVNRALIETALSDERGKDSALVWALLCKAEVTDFACFAAEECLQLHGAIGFTWEHECHLFLKRARLNQVMLGDNDRLRLEAAQCLPSSLLIEAMDEELDDADV